MNILCIGLPPDSAGRHLSLSRAFTQVFLVHKFQIKNVSVLPRKSAKIFNFLENVIFEGIGELYGIPLIYLMLTDTSVNLTIIITEIFIHSILVTEIIKPYERSHSLIGKFSCEVLILYEDERLFLTYLCMDLHNAEQLTRVELLV